VGKINSVGLLLISLSRNYYSNLKSNAEAIPLDKVLSIWLCGVRCEATQRQTTNCQSRASHNTYDSASMVGGTMIVLSLKTLILLWLINFAPPLLAHLLEDRWNRPLDRGRRFRDGRPLFGSHKTERGTAGAIITGYAAGLLLGFPWWLGMLTGVLSMLGDLGSSFIKRRLNQPSGTVAPGLDQIFEGLLPLLWLGRTLPLSPWNVLVLLIVFSSGAFIGSWFFKKVLLARPEGAYQRPLSSRVRLKELRRCHPKLTAFHVWLNFEDAIYYHVFMKSVFRLLGIYEKGRRNATQIRRREISFSFADLPEAFEGYRILYMSDLHLDGLDGLAENLQVLIRSMPANLCLVGGDLRMETHGPHGEALARFFRVVPDIQVRDGIYGVLGNHDCTEMIGPLKEAGVTILMNESVAIQRDSQHLWVVGVDDPHHFQCHDLASAFAGIPADDFVIFMSHSPEVYRDAERFGAQCYLCGHTHAGQIQIFPIGPIFTHSRTGRRYVEGAWEYGKMQGYTSSGVGASGVPVRFFSEGEVVLITLRRSPKGED
jgi:uncharacterized protein